MIKQAYIAMYMSDGTVAVLRPVFEAPRNAFDDDVALRHSFVLGEDNVWRRELTDAIIRAEIRHQYQDAQLRPVNWERIEESDLPTDRLERNKWRPSDITKAVQARKKAGKPEATASK